MEEINDTPHPDYSKGFNNGYLMAKHYPELSKELSKSLSNTEQSKGFEAGIREHFLEKVKSYEPSWMKEDVLPNEPDKSKDAIEHDKE